MTCACPHPRGGHSPAATSRLGVTFVGDALTAPEARSGKALAGRDAALLARQLKRAGLDWTDFGLTTAANCVPPKHEAHRCALRCLDRTFGPGVYVTLGHGAFERLTGQQMPPMLARGYAWPSRDGSAWVVPTLPSAYFRADAGMLATFVPDVQKAIRIAREGYAYTKIDSVWRPPLPQFDALVREFLEDASRPLAADIETPYKRKQDMSEEEKASGEDMTYTIDEFNFTWRPDVGYSVPWTPEYVPGILAMLAASQARGLTLWWNGAYDMPRIEANASIRFRAEGTCDVMDMFRVWRNSVSRKLVVATSLIPDNYGIPPWKHLGTDSPIYRAMDVVALLRNYEALVRLLKEESQWDAYCLFVRDLDPDLWRMAERGLRVDDARVSRLAADLPKRLLGMRAAMTAHVPEAARRTKVWKTEKAAHKGLEALRASGEVGADAVLRSVVAEATTTRCAACGATGVKKDHVTRKTRSA